MSDDGFDASEYPELEAAERRAMLWCAPPLLALSVATGLAGTLALFQAGATSAAVFLAGTGGMAQQLGPVALVQWALPAAALALSLSELGLAAACLLARTQRIAAPTLAGIRLIVLAHPALILGLPLTGMAVQLLWGPVP